ncbi:MAG: hypothetical protein AB6733_24325 [Clostridiaceae bacterium]
MRQNGFLTFIFSLIPGAGMMYMGLTRMGAEILLIFLGAAMLGDMISFPAFLIMVPLWFYSFFKTYEYGRKIERGEYIQDKSILFGEGNVMSTMSNNSGIKIFAVILIIFGSLSLVNRIFQELNIYHYVKGYMTPLVFIAIGLYILFKRK